MEFTLVILTLGIFLLLLAGLGDLQNDLKRINNKLDKINSILGVEEFTIDEEELKNLIKDGKRIKAVKKLRMNTGMGLKEAKDYVDNLYSHQQN